MKQTHISVAITPPIPPRRKGNAVRGGGTGRAGEGAGERPGSLPSARENTAIVPGSAFNSGEITDAHAFHRHYKAINNTNN